LTDESVAPLPVIDDLDTKGFWDAAHRGAVAVRACEACGLVLHPPRGICSRCHSIRTVWRDVAPTATLISWTIVRQSVHPGFPAPYAIVVVALDDEPGVRLVGRITDTPALKVGMAMHATFEAVNEDVCLVQWLPTATSNGLPGTSR
jgi:uncharacterized OB-fold protein